MRGSISKTQTFAGLLLYLCATLLAQPVGAVVISMEQSFDSPVSTGNGGRTLLVEEYTATWCSICSEVDPELESVADSHGSRIALVALHPTDGSDALQPKAAEHRITRMKAINPTIESTPTFVVEGGTPREGYDAWQDVQRDILNTELVRQNVTSMSFEVQKTEEGYRASIQHAEIYSRNGTQLTFLVIQHDMPVPDSGINVGGPTRDRVLLATAQCDLQSGIITTNIGLLSANVTNSCDDDFSIEFSKYESWSVILVHEPTLDSLLNGSDPMSLGAVEMPHRSISIESSKTSSWILIGLCCTLSLVAIWRKK